MEITLKELNRKCEQLKNKQDDREQELESMKNRYKSWIKDVNSELDSFDTDIKEALKKANLLPNSKCSIEDALNDIEEDIKRKISISSKNINEEMLLMKDELMNNINEQLVDLKKFSDKYNEMYELDKKLAHLDINSSATLRNVKNNDSKKLEKGWLVDSDED